MNEMRKLMEAVKQLDEIAFYDGEQVNCEHCGSDNVVSEPWTDDFGNAREQYTCNNCDDGWEY